MTTMYYDNSADLALIRAKKVAIIGYGSQGHAHALNLKDSGVDVRVGLPASSRSRDKAKGAGLAVGEVADVARWADVLMVLVPDTTAAQLYKEAIAPNLAAGKATQDLIRIACTYKGAMLWKMQAGMGDTVFGPLYQVLASRGVKLRFFHRAKHLSIDPDRMLLERIEIQPQVELKSKDQPYRPLYDVNGLPCWPSEPGSSRIGAGRCWSSGRAPTSTRGPPCGGCSIDRA